MNIVVTLFVLGEAPVTVPARNEYHVVHEILPLNLCFLEDDDVCFEDIEHSL